VPSDCFYWIILMLHVLSMIFIAMALSFAWAGFYVTDTNNDHPVQEHRFTQRLWGSACTKRVMRDATEGEYVTCDDFASFNGSPGRLLTLQVSGLFFLVGVLISVLALYEQIRNKMPILGRITFSGTSILCMVISIAIFFCEWRTG